MADHLFPYLVDAPEDGLIEERCELPIHDAETPEQAVEVLERIAECALGEDDFGPRHLRCIGRVFLRGVIEDSPEDETDDNYGYMVERIATLEDVTAGRDEEICFLDCSPDVEGATEWWRCEVIES